jgi:hypothetical protein
MGYQIINIIVLGVFLIELTSNVLELGFCFKSLSIDLIPLL